MNEEIKAHTWNKVLLGDVVKIGRGSSPRPIHDFLMDYAGIPWVKISDATASNNKFISSTRQFIREEGRSTSVEPGDLIVSNSATPGIPKIMSINACVHDGWLTFKDYNGIDKLFLYYFFLFYRKTLNQSATGSVFDNLKTEIVRNIPLRLPSISEQQSITNILSAFDNKIELLQDQNKTLEEITQTVFYEWFGKYQITGRLPESWKVGKLGDFNAQISDFVANGSFASLKENVTLYDSEEYALFIRNTDLKSGFNQKVYVDKKSYDFLSKTKLFGGEIIISNVGDVGSVHFCPYFDIPMTLGNNVIMLKSDFQYYFYTMFNSKIGQHLISSITGGSAQPKFNKTDFRNMEMVIPTEDILLKFDDFASKLYSKIFKNKEQIETLTKTRDELLPKLMTGEIRVNEFKV